MSKGGIAVLVVAAVVFLALGFVFGQVMQAASNNIDGPLVTEGYVHQYVGMAVAEIQTDIDKLEMRVLELSGGEGISTIPEPTGDPENTSPITPTTPTTPPAPTSVKIKSSGVNVRSDASTTASIAGSVVANTVLTYLGQKNDSTGQIWYEVRLADGTEGWVASWLCFEPE